MGILEENAVLEITLTGPKLEFLCNSIICLSGADTSPSINGKSVYLNKAIQVQQGDVLSFGKLQCGCRSYLAVAGGFLSNIVMGSRSMYNGITNSFRLKKNDVLEIENYSGNINKTVSLKIDKDDFKNHEIKVFEGPEFDLLPIKQREKLRSSNFTISNENSRMAYQLDETIENDLPSIITSLVLPGTVQLTPSGKLIILMRDCQTAGGYPRVLQLSEDGINLLAQKKVGDSINFVIKTIQKS